MTLSRRRFLSISAASLVAAPAHAERWQGRALGAEVEITIRAPRDVAVPALSAARDVLRQVEALFNLFDPASQLSRLNRTGQLKGPAPMFTSLMAQADRVHTATGGLFDPTVQPLWRALAEGRDTQAARRLIGWRRVRFDAQHVQLDSGQALTFNGIAQGFATDRVAQVLQAAGLRDTLVNVGEFRGAGGPWTIGLSDPGHGYLGARTITTGAVATTSPQAVPLAGKGQILHGHAVPKWSTVSVEAEDATTADGFSTALALASLEFIRTLVGRHGIRRISLVDMQGDLSTV